LPYHSISAVVENIEFRPLTALNGKDAENLACNLSLLGERREKREGETRVPLCFEKLKGKEASLNDE
jgi:hypothetical protein